MVRKRDIFTAAPVEQAWESSVHLDLGCLMRERLGVMEEIDRSEGDRDGQPLGVSAASGGRIVMRPTGGGECG